MTPGEPAPPPRPAPGGRRPVIGMLINTLFEGYEVALWKGVLRGAEEADADLLCFVGGRLGDPTRRWMTFDLVQRGCVDGLVVIAPSLSSYAGLPALGRLLARLDPMPVVSLSETVPGAACLLVDNAGGIAQAMEHLVEAHGRRRIAFVQGPPCSSEAGARFDAYRSALARLGLSFDPDLVVEGDYHSTSGMHAVRELLDERRLRPDALLCSNDLMALSAMGELRRRGLDVPGDVAVCGFDDVTDAASATPPLTTVAQPLFEMGRDAARRVVAMIRGEPTPPLPLYATRLIVRRSCGCSGLEVEPTAPRAAPPRRPAPLALHLEASFPGLGVRSGVAAWAAELSTALETWAAGADDRVFLRALERVVSQGLERIPEPAPWSRVVREAIAWLRRDATAAEATRLSALCEGALTLVGSIATSAQLARRMRTDEENLVLTRLVRPFPTRDDEYIRRLLDGLASLDVPSFFLARTLDGASGMATLLAHRDSDGIAELDDPTAPFPSPQLIPGRFNGRRRRAHAVLPIESPEDPIGFALCEIGALTSAGHERLMHQISIVLSVNGLVAEVQEQHRQLLETARQAGMAEVAVGVLHDVGNLLNSVGVSAEAIHQTVQQARGCDLGKGAALLAEHAGDLPAFFATDPRGALLPAWLRQSGAELRRHLERIEAETEELQERTALIRDSIRTLQDHTRAGRDLHQPEPVELAVLVQAALEIQRAELDRWRVRVEQRLAAVPPLWVPRAKLVHVLVNLVKNAVEAMRATPEGGRRLVVEAHVEGDTVRLDLRDSGAGIAPGDLERLFSYGFTTKPDGHGFGLHTCASYMKQMGGSIRASSEGPGRGATFTLMIDARWRQGAAGPAGDPAPGG